MKLITEKRVLLNENFKDKKEAIEKMARLFVNDGVIEENDYENYLSSLLEREEIASTAVGFEVGLPHGKSSVVKYPGVAFARLKNPIIWCKEEKEVAKYIFMLAIPSAAVGNEHINILVDLSKKLLDDDFREVLSNSKAIETIVKAINKE